MTNSVLVVPAQKQILLQIFLGGGGEIGFSVCDTELEVSQYCVCHHPSSRLKNQKQLIYSRPDSFKLSKAVRDKCKAFQRTCLCDYEQL